MPLEKEQPAPSKRRRGRPSIQDSADRRHALLLAAIDGFGARGFDGVSLGQIAGRVNADIGLTRYYFGSKDGLWKTAIEYLSGLFNEELEKTLRLQPSSATDSLKAVIRFFISFSAKWPQVSRVIVFDGNTESARGEYITTQLVRPFYQLLSTLIEAAKAEGTIDDIAPRTLFFMITHGGAFPMALPALTNALPGGDINAEQNLKAHSESIIQLIFKDIRNTQ